MMLVSEDGDVERDQCFLRVAGERWRGSATDERNCLGYINEGARLALLNASTEI
jgi:hypothetical protein